MRFLAVVLAVLGAVVFYLSRRSYQGLVCLFPRLKFVAVFAFYLLTTLLMSLGFASSRLPFSQTVCRLLNRGGMYWMGFFVYLLLFMIAVDAAVLFVRVCGVALVRKPMFGAARILCVLTLALATTIYGFAHVNDLQYATYEVRAEGKTDVSDMNIVLISDLHLGAIGSENRLAEVVSRINALKPDLVCIAGDFFDSDFAAIRDPEKAKDTLRQLSATYGVYACLGNHDAGRTAGQMQEFLADCHIQLLNEAYTVIDNRLVLAGRLDASPIGGYGQLRRGRMADWLPAEMAQMPVVVMDHNPAHIGEYGTEADLILSGHTHKGQIFPGSIITGNMYDVDYGHYQKDANRPHVIVTSGVGYWGMPMRVGTDCEIVQIRITP